jgi:phosphatidylinositol alpha-mannosyltransferase
VTNGIANLLGASRRMNRLHLRIAVSEAAAHTARRFFGGRYTIVPNGVRGEGGPLKDPDREGPLRVLFIGQAVERKGLPVLLSAFEALRDQVPATLTLVGAGPEHVSPFLLEDRGVRALGKVDEERKLQELRSADVLCAPSLGGESFGMVLTEAFAAGVPVVASDIAGYRDVVRHGREGILVPPSDPVELGRALREMALEVPTRVKMAQAARRRSERFLWPQVAAEVLDCYERAQAVGTAPTRRGRLAVRYGLARAELQPPRPVADPVALAASAPAQVAAAVNAKPTESGATPKTSQAARVPRVLRRLALAVSSLVAVGLVVGGLADVGVWRVEANLAGSEPGLLMAGLALMCTAMLVRGLAWHAILRAAPTLPTPRLRDVMHATCIGVLMSATLPARMGEPARALIVARRLGRVRETLPVVLGTVISQMLLNLFAVVVLAVLTFTTVNGLQGHDTPLIVLAAAPGVLLLALTLAPVVVPGAPRWRPRTPVDLVRAIGAAVGRMRQGMRVFGNPRQAPLALALQLAAWTIQWLCCWLLLVALGLNGRVDLAGAAAVLLAVNFTALLPLTPGNVGIFQVAVVAVLVGVYDVSAAGAIAYGIALQAVEMATALLMGLPALADEGISWRELRVRTVHATPVVLDPLPRGVSAGSEAASPAGAPASA